MPGHRDQVGDALDALAQHVVRDAERVEHRRLLVEHLEQLVVRDHDHGVAVLAQRLDALGGLGTAFRALEMERRRDDADRERAELPRDARDDRRAAGPGSAALARGHEDHVRAAQRALDLVVGLFGRAAPEIGRRTGAEALGQLASDVDLDRRIRERELLDVRVDGDELDVRDARIDHAVDRVQPGAADSDDADDGRVGARLRVRRAMQARRRLGQRLDARQLLDGAQVRLGRGSRFGLDLGLHLDDGLERRSVLDGLLERLEPSLSFGLGLLRVGLVLPLALRGFGRPEELRERALTHACALSRHREPPSPGLGTPSRRSRSGRT